MIGRLLGPYLGWIAGGLVVVVLVLGWLYRDALKDLGAAAAETQRVTKANADLKAAIDKMEAFQADVREGFKNLQSAVQGLQAVNTTFKSKVAADADSLTPLTAGERDRLIELFGPNRVRGGPVAPVRDPGAP